METNGKSEIRRIFYESGKVQAETSYREGKMHGICRTYYESGVLLAEASFKENMLHGTRKEYYKTGKLKREDIWSNNKLLSSVRYDEKGETIAVKNFGS